MAIPPTSSSPSPSSSPFGPNLSLTLRLIPGRFAIARLPADAALPDWLPRKGFSAMVRADDELTVVCPQSNVPQRVQTDGGWACLRSVGPFAFDAAGVVHALVAPLSQNGIGVFVLCTFDGEHLMVKEADLEPAKRLLVAAGHSFIP